MAEVLIFALPVIIGAGLPAAYFTTGNLIDVWKFAVPMSAGAMVAMSSNPDRTQKGNVAMILGLSAGISGAGTYYLTGYNQTAGLVSAAIVGGFFAWDGMRDKK